MRHNFLTAVLIGFGLAGVANAGPVVFASNAFESGAQGWTSFSFGYTQTGGQPDFSLVFGGAGSVIHNEAGGNPNGYISLSDPDGGNEYFVAGGDFHGNFSAAYGGFFSFDQIRLENAELTPDLPASPIIALANGSTVVVYSNQDATPTGIWQSYAIPLTTRTPGWFVGSIAGNAATSEELYSVLSNIQGAFIMADWYFGADAYGIDNVSISNTPEPGTLWLLFAAVVLIAGCNVGTRRRCAVKLRPSRR